MLTIISVSQSRNGAAGADIVGELNGQPFKAYLDFQLGAWRGYIVSAKVTLPGSRQVELSNHLTVAAPPTVDGREVEPGLFLSADDQKIIFKSCKDLKRPYTEKQYMEGQHRDTYGKWDY